MKGALKKEALRRAEQSMVDKARNNSRNKPSIHMLGGVSKSNSIGGLVKAPVNTFRERRSYFDVDYSRRKKADLVVSGQDYLGAVAIPNGAVDPGTNLLNILVNPQTGMFDATRLSQFSRLYEKYCFRRLRFHIQTSIPTSTQGSYLLAYDRDMADETPAPNSDGIKQYFGMQGTRSAPIWEDLSIDCPLIDTQDFYYTNYTGVDGRITTQGQVYVSVLSTINSGGFSSGLSLWVEYECHFMIPELNLVQRSLKTSNVSPTAQSLFEKAPGSINFTDVALDLLDRELAGNTLKVVPKSFSGTPLGDIAGDIQPFTGIDKQVMLPRGCYEIVLNSTIRTPGPPTGSAWLDPSFDFYAFTRQAVGAFALSVAPLFKVAVNSLLTNPTVLNAAVQQFSTFTIDSQSIQGGRIVTSIDQTGNYTPSNIQQSLQVPMRLLVRIRDLVTPLCVIVSGLEPGYASVVDAFSNLIIGNWHLQINEIDQRAFDAA